MKMTLKAARVNRGLTQSDMVKKLNVYQPTYSNWENGITPIKDINKIAIAATLNMQVSDIEWPEVKEDDDSSLLEAMKL